VDVSKYLPEYLPGHEREEIDGWVLDEGIKPSWTGRVRLCFGCGRFEAERFSATNNRQSGGGKLRAWAEVSPDIADAIDWEYRFGVSGYARPANLVPENRRLEWKSTPTETRTCF